MRVQSAKPGETRGLCLRCYYIKRGSFNQLKAQELLELVWSTPALRDKLLSSIPSSSVVGPRFRSMRKRHVVCMCNNPKGRPRHEAINLKLYTEARESQFTELFQDCSATDVLIAVI